VTSPELGATEIVDLLGDVVLVRLANGQPAVIYQSLETSGFVAAAVPSPHEPDLQPVGLGFGVTLLCGASSCALYDIQDETLVLAAFDPVPLPPEDVRGVIRTNAFPDDPDCAPSVGDERLVCVFGRGVACLVEGSTEGWTVVAPASATDAFLDAAQLTPGRIRFVGEGGRLGRVERSDTNALTWTEEERITTASLRAIEVVGSQAGFIVGDQGAFLDFTRDAMAACDTGDQDWLLAPGYAHFISANGEVFGPHWTEEGGSGSCIAQLPKGGYYRAASSYEAGTTWGLRFADAQRVYEKMTGYTE
jgi:hypothetical protein